VVTDISEQHLSSIFSVEYFTSALKMEAIRTFETLQPPTGIHCAITQTTIDIFAFDIPCHIVLQAYRARPLKQGLIP
jgi:hypothetical protein